MDSSDDQKRVWRNGHLMGMKLDIWVVSQTNN